MNLRILWKVGRYWTSRGLFVPWSQWIILLYAISVIPAAAVEGHPVVDSPWWLILNWRSLGIAGRSTRTFHTFDRSCRFRSQLRSVMWRFLKSRLRWVTGLWKWSERGQMAPICWNWQITHLLLAYSSFTFTFALEPGVYSKVVSTAVFQDMWRQQLIENRCLLQSAV